MYSLTIYEKFPLLPKVYKETKRNSADRQEVKPADKKAAESLQKLPKTSLSASAQITWQSKQYLVNLSQ